MPLSTREKALALEALSPIELRLDINSQWFVHHRVDVADGHFLTGLCGRGATTDEAIEDHWRKLVDKLPADNWLVVDAGRDTRRAVRWNGFMWAAYPEPSEAR